MHPDQYTPDSHRYSSPDSNKPRVPAQEQDLPAEAETTGTTVRTPEPDEKRLGEAGNEYVGRQLDDDLKANPRVGRAERVQADDES